MRAVVVVGYNVAKTVREVTLQVPEELKLYFVDDGSQDGSAELVSSRTVVLRHPENLGYGAAQKTGYRAALQDGAERIALLHGDGQYDPPVVLGLLDLLDQADVALGSRFLAEDHGRIIPWWRRLANRGLTQLANRALSMRCTDLHTGARAYRAEALQRLPLESFSDDYVFDQQVLIGLATRGMRFTEGPIQGCYEGDVQSIGFRRSVVYGLGCVRTILTARH